MAFLFTVFGEWLVEGKVISRGMSRSARRRVSSVIRVDCQELIMGKKETGIGMVLSLAGIALCVQSKN